MEETRKGKNITNHLANERTFLAWIRTSVGLMAFGFVVVKFSLFIRQISMLVGKEVVIPNRGYSVIVGIVLVGAGMVTTALSFLRYQKTKKQIEEENYKNSNLLILVVTAIIFLASILLIGYLIESTKF